MKFDIFTFTRKIHRPLLLDGAMGSLLQQKGIKAEGRLWTAKANLTNPELVFKIHESYIKAGADIITTNTFRTNPLAIKNFPQINFKYFVRSAVQLAKQAAQNHNVLIAGSNSPAEDSYQVERTVTKKQLAHNHKNHIDELMQNGCSFVLNETHGHFDEIKIICDYCSKKNIPFVLSLFVKNNLTLLSGEHLTEVIKYILDHNPLAVGFNCLRSDVFDKIYRKIKFNFNWGVYLNLGSGNDTDSKITAAVSPNLYAEIMKRYLPQKPSFIGGCCGSNPNHIKKLKKMLDERIIY